MTPKDLASAVRLRTRTNSTTFPDADIKTLLAMKFDEFAGEVIQLDEDYFGMPQTTDLVADQREYPLPNDMLNRIKKVEAKFDGTNWVQLFGMDLNEYEEPTSEGEITNNFSNTEGEAFYDIFRGSLWIYSGTISAVTDGLKLWSYSFPEHVTDLTSEVDMSQDPSNTAHGMPRVLHPLLVDAISIDYKSSREKPIPLTEREQSFEIHMQQALNTLKKVDKSHAVQGNIPSEKYFGNSGYDY